MCLRPVFEKVPIPSTSSWNFRKDPTTSRDKKQRPTKKWTKTLQQHAFYSSAAVSENIWAAEQHLPKPESKIFF